MHLLFCIGGDLPGASPGKYYLYKTGDAFYDLMTIEARKITKVKTAKETWISCKHAVDIA
jgi:hypothetical protein